MGGQDTINVQIKNLFDGLTKSTLDMLKYEDGRFIGWDHNRWYVSLRYFDPKTRLNRIID